MHISLPSKLEFIALISENYFNNSVNFADKK